MEQAWKEEGDTVGHHNWQGIKIKQEAQVGKLGQRDCMALKTGIGIKILRTRDLELAQWGEEDLGKLGWHIYRMERKRQKILAY